MGISTLILGTQSKKAKSLLNSASLPAEITEFQSHFWDDRGFKALTSTLLKGLRASAKFLTFSSTAPMQSKKVKPFKLPAT